MAEMKAAKTEWRNGFAKRIGKMDLQKKKTSEMVLLIAYWTGQWIGMVDRRLCYYEGSVCTILVVNIGNAWYSY